MGYGYGVECHFQHYSSFIGRGNRRKPLTNFITQCCIKYTSPFVVIELALLMVIGTDFIGSCKSNSHTIATTTAPSLYIYFVVFFRETVGYVWK